MLHLKLVRSVESKDNAAISMTGLIVPEGIAKVRLKMLCFEQTYSRWAFLLLLFFCISNAAWKCHMFKVFFLIPHTFIKCTNVCLAADICAFISPGLSRETLFSTKSKHSIFCKPAFQVNTLGCYAFPPLVSNYNLVSASCYVISLFGKTQNVQNNYKGESVLAYCAITYFLQWQLGNTDTGRGRVPERWL